jgi:serine/threonine protein kinase
MFAILNRSQSVEKPLHPESRSQAAQPEKQRNVGASMKFQYGNGDKPLDGFVIKRGVGSGGFGEVYFAESESGKEVALKRIQKNLEVEVRGVRHCLNLRHPNLVGIYDIRFDKEEQGWIVMEFIAGESLREQIDRHSNTINTQETITFFAQLVAGVAYLHDQGIVHRDLKPANVFIDNSLVKIGDYGLSKYISASRRGGQTESVGTFHYMAPEIGRGEYGKEIDIYSLGIILYEMLTGVVPFDGESSQEIILKHLTADPDVSMIPQPYASAIDRCLAKNSSSRYRDCRELLQAIGWELDRSGLAVRSSNMLPIANIPPVLQPLASSPSIPLGKPIGNDHSTVAGSPVVTPILGNGTFGANAAFAGELYQEPVARAIQQTIWDVQTWFRNLPKGMQGLGIGGLIILLVTNGGWIAPLAFLALCAYMVYYFIWYISGGPSKVQPTSKPAPFGSPRQPSPATPKPRSAPSPNFVAAPAAPKPASIPYRVALKNWQRDQRTALKDRGLWTQVHSRTRAWTFSGMVIAVLALAGSLLTQARIEGDTSGWIGGIAWTAIMAMLTSWTVIYFARRWEAQPEDSIVYRFVLMSAGVGLGLISYGISDHLMVPWSEITKTSWAQFEIKTPSFSVNDWNKSWKGFYGEGSSPLLAAHIAYFASLMWIVRWWRQSDILRKHRFSFWAIAWSVAMAALVQGLFYFPTPWCLIVAGVTSFAVQMASPWLSYKDSDQVA